MIKIINILSQETGASLINSMKTKSSCASDLALHC